MDSQLLPLLKISIFENFDFRELEFEFIRIWFIDKTTCSSICSKSVNDTFTAKRFAYVDTFNATCYAGIDTYMWIDPFIKKIM